MAPPGFQRLSIGAMIMARWRTADTHIDRVAWFCGQGRTRYYEAHRFNAHDAGRPSSRTASRGLGVPYVVQASLPPTLDHGTPCRCPIPLVPAHARQVAGTRTSLRAEQHGWIGRRVGSSDEATYTCCRSCERHMAGERMLRPAHDQVPMVVAGRLVVGSGDATALPRLRRYRHGRCRPPPTFHPAVTRLRCVGRLGLPGPQPSTCPEVWDVALK